MPKSMEEALQKGCKNIGIKPGGVHKIRKSVASSLVNSGLSMTAVKTLLGQKNILTTANYYIKDNNSKEKEDYTFTNALDSRRRA